MKKQLIETQLPVSELHIGMHVIRLDRPWLETDFLLQGFIIQNQDDIRRLQQQCNWVFVEGVIDLTNRRYRPDTTGSNKSKPAYSHQKVLTQRVRYINKVSFEQEIEAAKTPFHEARQFSKQIMDGLRFGAMLDINQAKKTVEQCVQSILRNEFALRVLSQIKNRDEYTAEHSMNVCILSATFAKHLGLSESEIEKVGLCGLLHDVGKTRIPLEVLNKEGALTADEFELMRQHPAFGRDILMSTPGCDHITVDAAHAHHERISGGGYPRGLTDHQIPFFAKIVAITDTYDAITSNRCYSQARSSKDALDIIFKCRGEQFDDELALEFIQCIGIYPPGCTVEMTNGEVGIIISNNSDGKLRPKVLLVRDANKRPAPEHVVDLNLGHTDPNGVEYVLHRELPAGSHGINLQEYLDRGLQLASLNPG